jgi:hypothetical protein
MGMLHRATYGQKELQSLARRETLLVAVLSNRDTSHQLHDEERTAALRGPGVEHPRYVGVVHECQRLPFCFEAGDNLASLYSGFNDLQRDTPLHGMCLFGHEDHAHASLADHLQEFVGPNSASGFIKETVG